MNIFAAILIASLVVGQDEDQRKKKFAGKKFDPTQMIKRIDKDGDGSISKEELSAAPERIQGLLERMDRDGDGTISKQEWSAAAQIMQAKRGDEPKGKAKRLEKGAAEGGALAARMKQLDKNNDGTLAKDEVEGLLAQRFDVVDQNSDGFLTRDELAEAGKQFRKMEPKGKGDAPPKKREKGKTPPKGKGKGDAAKGRGMQLLQSMDGNKDGKLSKEEMQGPLAKAFPRLDRNKDGFLDADEFSVAQRALKGAGRGGFAGGPSIVDQFNQQDSDADGRLTKAEAKGLLSDRFEELDANKDSKLSRQEVEAGLKEKKDAKKE